MGEEVLWKVWDGLVDPSRGPGRVGGPSWRSGTGWGTLSEDRDGSWDPPVGLGWVGDPP